MIPQKKYSYAKNDYFAVCPKITLEPRHYKTNKRSVRPAKTQISLGIRPVWSESLLYAQWVAKDPSFLHADSEDWSDWADAQADDWSDWAYALADLSLRWAHTHFVGFVMSRLTLGNSRSHVRSNTTKNLPEMGGQDTDEDRTALQDVPSIL